MIGHQVTNANVLDFVEPGPLLSDEVVKPPIVSKATVQRCISKLSPHWTDEQLDQVVEMFKRKTLCDQDSFAAGIFGL